VRKPAELPIWVFLFGGTAIFQFWRKSPVDGWIFILFILVLFAPTKQKTNLRRGGGAYLLLICALLTVVKIHTPPATVLSFALVPLIFLNSSPPTKQKSWSHALSRSGRLWTTIGLLTCIWELTNYFSGYFLHNDPAFPTISMLVDPALHQWLGKVTFAYLLVISGRTLLTRID
jgi:hypothetical protein